MIGADREAIDSEDREKFRVAMNEIGLATPRSLSFTAWKKPGRGRSDRFSGDHSPVFHHGGSGGGIAYNREFEDIIRRGLDLCLPPRC